MKLTKKFTAFILAFCLVACTGLLSACTNNESKPEETQTLTLLIPEWGAPSEEMLKQFKDETGIEVVVEVAGWDEIKQKVSVASSGNNAAADLIEVDWSWVGEFTSAGWLEKISVPESVQKDMPSLTYFTVDGQAYAIPYTNDMRIAYLNTDMSKKAGVETTPTNWTELEQAFGKMKKAGVDHPMLFPLTAEEKTTTSFLTLAYTRNNVVFNKDNTLNRESVHDALTLLEKMVKEGYINPNNVSTPGIDVFKGIQNANGAFLEGPSSYLTSVNDEKVSKVVGQVEAIEFPGKEGPATKSISFTEAVGISSFSKNKEAAQKFIEWYYRPETQAQLNRATSLLPTRTSVLSEMIHSGEIKAPEFVIAQSQNVDTPFPNGVPKYYAQMSSEIYNIVNQLGQGKLTADQATDMMVEKVDALAKSQS